MSYSYHRNYTNNHSNNNDAPDSNLIKMLDDQIRSQSTIIGEAKQKIFDQSCTITRLETELNHRNSVSQNNRTRNEYLEQQNRQQTEMINQLKATIQNISKANFEFQTENTAVKNDLKNWVQSSKSQKSTGNFTNEELIENLKYEVKCDQKEISELFREIEKLKRTNTILEEDKANQLHSLKLAYEKIQSIENKAETQNNPQKERPFENPGQSEINNLEFSDFHILEEKTPGPKDIEIGCLKRELLKIEAEFENMANQVQDWTEFKRQVELIDEGRKLGDMGALLSELKNMRNVHNSLSILTEQTDCKSVTELLSQMKVQLEKPLNLEKLEYFQGNIVNNQKNGFGVEITKDGQKYSGMFKNNLRNGFGKLETKEFEFQGEFKNGEFDSKKGFYREFTVNKSLDLWESVKYVGETKTDKPHGKGTLIFENGIKIDTQFIDGKIECGVESVMRVKEGTYLVSVLDLPDMGISIFSTPDKSHAWILNNKTGLIQKS